MEFAFMIIIFDKIQAKEYNLIFEIYIEIHNCKY